MWWAWCVDVKTDLGSKERRRAWSRWDIIGFNHKVSWSGIRWVAMETRWTVLYVWRHRAASYIHQPCGWNGLCYSTCAAGAIRCCCKQTWKTSPLFLSCSLSGQVQSVSSETSSPAFVHKREKVRYCTLCSNSYDDNFCLNVKVYLLCT